MQFRTLLAITLAACVAVGIAPVSARLIESWPYEKLFEKADLVVIAEAGKAEAALDEPPGSTWAYEFAGQVTTLKVNHALKGKLKDKEIRVLHFKFGKLKKDVKPDSLEAMLITDGPMLVAFRTEPVTVTDGEGKKVIDVPEYMLFLKRMKDGRYEPVSGRIDPAQSVREVGKTDDRVLVRKK